MAPAARAAWLVAVAGVEEAEARRLEADIRRSLAVSQLVFVRWGLLLVHFERELYRDPDQDLDALWWRMAADFQKVRPPAGRRAPDWASKIHLGVAPVYYQNYLLGELTEPAWRDSEEPRQARGGYNQGRGRVGHGELDGRRRGEGGFINSGAASGGECVRLTRTRNLVEGPKMLPIASSTIVIMP